MLPPDRSAFSRESDWPHSVYAETQAVRHHERVPFLRWSRMLSVGYYEFCIAITHLRET